MGKTVSLKNPESRLVVAGREPITNANVTVEVAEALIKENPNFANEFVFTEDKPVVVKSKE